MSLEEISLYNVPSRKISSKQKRDQGVGLASDNLGDDSDLDRDDTIQLGSTAGSFDSSFGFQ
jgi:hypothetical protein